MKIKLFYILLGVFFIGASNIVLAAPLTNGLNNLKKAVGENSSVGLQGDLSTSIGTVIAGLLSLVGTIFLVLTVWAGIMWMTAQGNDEKVLKAKGILTQAVIGLIVVMAAYAITAFVTGRIGGEESSGACVSPGMCATSTNCSSSGGTVVSGTCAAGEVCCQ